MDTVIFDLGDVLFEWSSLTAMPLLSEESIRTLFKSDIWSEYETARCTESEVHRRLSALLETSEPTITSALELMRESIRSSPQMFETVRLLKKSGIKVYAMSNISQPDWEVLKTRASGAQWDLFDDVYPS